jgi:bidirectional [NiFe] hydrogenase diaphorase subunit
MTRVVTFKIDDQDVSGREDETILDLARENGIDIPTLCHLDGLSDVGACRLCLVEVVGSPKLLPACTLRPQEGMEVYTHSERLAQYRRMVIELLFTEGNHICSVCVSNGHCDLQALAQKLGVDHISLPYRSPRRQVDASHERYTLDPNRCVLCTRCVRVCDEVEGAHTWDVMGRGIRAQVITDLRQPWGDAESCTSCGKCVQVCPTGALSIKGKSVAEMAKQREFLPYLVQMRERRK